MKPKHFNIPIFIPEASCPNRCIYCNQFQITGRSVLPSSVEVFSIIEKHLKTIADEKAEVEIAFFGGNFTGLPVEQQEKYLDIAQKFLSHPLINGIRISTRPDYISEENLMFLKTKSVSVIEIGAQSFDNDVLKASGRNYSSDIIDRAALLIKKYKFRLGIQMMTGLPEDSDEKSFHTASKIVSHDANETRIYPCIVLKGTMLEKLYNNGKYTPQHLNDAVQLASRIHNQFHDAKIKILKVGLHPSESLISNKEIVAGPFHPQFHQLVLSEIWNQKISTALNKFENTKSFVIFVPTNQIENCIGFKKSNIGNWRKIGYKLQIKPSDNIEDFNYQIFVK